MLGVGACSEKKMAASSAPRRPRTSLRACPAVFFSHSVDESGARRPRRNRRRPGGAGAIVSYGSGSVLKSVPVNLDVTGTGGLRVFFRSSFVAVHDAELHIAHCWSAAPSRTSDTSGVNGDARRLLQPVQLRTMSSRGARDIRYSPQIGAAGVEL